MDDRVRKSDSEWKKSLSPEQYAITRKKGTEPPFTGKFYTFHEKGIYTCVCCGQQLFSSGAKYNSGSGWPSYYEPVNSEAVETEIDTSHGMTRTEIKCSRCGAHLGHLFDDGPEPTGKRYCVNSASLDFTK